MIKDEHKTDHAVDADPGSWAYAGALPGALALNCCDIGRATVNGKSIIITWGRNLTADEQRHYAERTTFRMVRLGAWDGSAELIIEPDDAAKLLPILL